MASIHIDTFWPPLTLHNNIKMPAVGFGTYRIRKEDLVFKAVDAALGAGYRLFDTASVYNNETHLKKAFAQLLPKYGLKRKDIFVTTKLSPSDMGERETVKKAVRNSFDNLGFNYIDLFLIHFPGVPQLDPKDSRHRIYRNTAWEVLTELYETGMVHAIGVSNFTTKHLEDLAKDNHGAVPTVNQVEWHPYFHEEELLKYCTNHNIVLQGYSPFGGANSAGALLDDKTVKAIAKRHNVTAAQVLLVWSLHKNVGVIPKSLNPVRIQENYQLQFKLTDDEINTLDTLDTTSKFAWSSYEYL